VEMVEPEDHDSGRMRKAGARFQVPGAGGWGNFEL